MIGGVCGGLAEYFNIDPTLVRLAFVALALLGGNGVLIYLVLLILVPNEPDASDTVIDAAPPASQDDHPTI
jgi:phage shock protein C